MLMLTERILRSDAMKATDTFDRIVDEQSHCNKDTEGLTTMNTYSRRHLFFVHPVTLVVLFAIGHHCTGLKIPLKFLCQLSNFVHLLYKFVQLP